MLVIRVVENDVDYDEAMERLSVLMDLNPEKGTPEAAELRGIALLIADYEKRQNYMPTYDVTPLDIIKFFMEQNELTPKDMIAYLGSASKVSEVLSGKRGLSLTMIRKLHKGLHIPAELLIRSI